MLKQDHGDAPGRNKKPGSSGIFESLYPSETAGNGNVCRNNMRSGFEQGKPSTKRKARCRQCGFPSDLNKDDNSGGSLDGNGALGPSTATTESWTDKGGADVTEYSRSAIMRKGGGCKMCGSKNWAKTPGRQTPPPGPAPLSGI